MSDTTRWQTQRELGSIWAALGTKVSGTDPGHWLDFSATENIRLSISGTITGGSYDVLGCDLIQRPDDADNAHPSLLQGLSGAQLNWLQFTAPPHWIKFITTSLVGTVSCGATADLRDAWKR